MSKLITNCIGCWKHVPYTSKHYIAFLKTEKTITGKISHWFHDWDKLILFILIPWVGEEKINHLHRKYREHHFTYWENDKLICKPGKNISEDAVREAVIDWECARFTKPDKPLNARETMNRYYSEYKEIVEPVLEDFGL